MLSKNYISAVATVVGTVIGAGIFALPILVNRSGLIPFIFFLVALAAIQYLYLKMYASVVLATKSEHRVPGYVEAYGGKRYKKLVSLICLLGGYGGLLAYIILGGLYAHELLSPIFGGSAVAYSIGLFAVQAVVVLFGLKAISRAELALSIILVLVAGLISWKGLANFNADNFKLSDLSDWRFSLMLYGPVFFSLGGDAAVPEVCRLLVKEKHRIKSALLWGTVISASITGLFVLAAVWAVGNLSTPDTLVGLNRVLDGGIIYLALIFGVINIATSFLVSLQALREIYWWDFKMNETFSWFLAAAVPLGLFLLGVKNVTSVVSLTGAVTGGILCVIMIRLSQAAARRPQRKAPFKVELGTWPALILTAIFLAGFAYEVLSVFKII
jgi:amino acid permease